MSNSKNTRTILYFFLFCHPPTPQNRLETWVSTKKTICLWPFLCSVDLPNRPHMRSWPVVWHDVMWCHGMTSNVTSGDVTKSCQSGERTMGHVKNNEVKVWQNGHGTLLRTYFGVNLEGQCQGKMREVHHHWGVFIPRHFMHFAESSLF